MSLRWQHEEPDSSPAELFVVFENRVDPYIFARREERVPVVVVVENSLRPPVLARGFEQVPLMLGNCHPRPVLSHDPRCAPTLIMVMMRVQHPLQRRHTCIGNKVGHRTAARIDQQPGFAVLDQIDVARVLEYEQVL